MMFLFAPFPSRQHSSVPLSVTCTTPLKGNQTEDLTVVLCLLHQVKPGHIGSLGTQNDRPLVPESFSIAPRLLGQSH